MNRPNFILIFADQWRGDCLSVLGHPIVETPFLDNIAAEGTIFNSAYSASPSCIPARACLATGKTPNGCGRIGYEDKVIWNYEITMMSTLRDNGYQTINVGKTHFYPQRAHLGFEINNVYDPQDFGNGFVSDYHKWLEKESNGAVKDTAKTWNSNMWVALPWEGPTYMHPTEWTTDTAIEAIEDRDPMRPFFLQVGYHRPHPPLDPPTYYYDMYKDKELDDIPIGDWAKVNDIKISDVTAYKGKLPSNVADKMRRSYYASITHIDAQIGKLLFYLNKKGLTNNTYLIFTSDHGELLGDHHMYRKIMPLEGSAKIPFIVRPAKDFINNRIKVSDLPITHMDVMPTILEQAGIKIPEGVEGISFNKVFNGEKVIGRDFIHGEHTGYGQSGWQFVTDGKQKYFWDSYSGRKWLFDLTIDSKEEKNLINNVEYKDDVEKWEKRLIDILKDRPEDGLSDGEKLIEGSVPEKVREWLRNI